ncbi:MAG: hypothetical protein EA369_02440 [Bradymonadales bacterium]|nr:MAG: hypothetical protein EA369_02440 [Bradymonadales bacterium]
MRTVNPFLKDKVFLMRRLSPSSELAKESSVYFMLFVLLSVFVGSALVASWLRTHFSMQLEFRSPFLPMLVALVGLALGLRFFYEFSRLFGFSSVLLSGALFGFYYELLIQLFDGIFLQLALVLLASLCSMIVLSYKNVLHEPLRVRDYMKYFIFSILTLHFFIWIFRVLENPIPYIHEMPLIRSLICILSIVLIGIFLTNDFKSLRRALAMRLPKPMEAYLSMGILYGVLWMPIGIVQLILKASEDQD